MINSPQPPKRAANEVTDAVADEPAPKRQESTAPKGLRVDSMVPSAAGERVSQLAAPAPPNPRASPSTRLLTSRVTESDRLGDLAAPPNSLDPQQVKLLGQVYPNSYFDNLVGLDTESHLLLPPGPPAVQDLLVARGLAAAQGLPMPEVPGAMALAALDYAVVLGLPELHLTAIVDHIEFQNVDDALTAAHWATDLGFGKVAEGVFELAMTAIIKSPAPPTPALIAALQPYSCKNVAVGSVEALKAHYKTLPPMPFNLLEELCLAIALSPVGVHEALLRELQNINPCASFWLIKRAAMYLDPTRVHHLLLADKQWLEADAEPLERGAVSGVYEDYIHSGRLSEGGKASKAFALLTTDTIRTAPSQTEPLAFQARDPRYNYSKALVQGVLHGSNLENLRQLVTQLIVGDLIDIGDTARVALFSEIVWVMHSDWTKEQLADGLKVIAEHLKLNVNPTNRMDPFTEDVVCAAASYGATEFLDMFVTQILAPAVLPDEIQAFVIYVTEGIIAGRRIELLGWLERKLAAYTLSHDYGRMEVLPASYDNIMQPRTLFGDLPSTAVYHLLQMFGFYHVFRTSTQLRAELLVDGMRRLLHLGAFSAYTNAVSLHGNPLELMNKENVFPFIGELGVFANTVIIEKFLSMLSGTVDDMPIIEHLGLDREELNKHITRTAKSCFDSGREAQGQLFVDYVGQGYYESCLAELNLSSC